MPSDRVLILDDDPVVGLVLSMAIRACGHEAVLCDDPHEFVAALQSGPASHAVIDLSLREGSGCDVLQALAAAGSGIRVIICSGAERSELEAALARARALGLATAGVLAKPFRQAELRALLQSPA